jgi:hypothetical protein
MIADGAAEARVCGCVVVSCRCNNTSTRHLPRRPIRERGERAAHHRVACFSEREQVHAWRSVKRRVERLYGDPLGDRVTRALKRRRAPNGRFVKQRARSAVCSYGRQCDYLLLAAVETAVPRSL